MASRFWRCTKLPLRIFFKYKTIDGRNLCGTRGVNSFLKLGGGAIVPPAPPLLTPLSTYLVHNFSHIRNQFESILISNTFRLFRFSSSEDRDRPRSTTNVHDLDLLKPPVTLVTDKRAPDLDWFTSYSLFGPLCLVTGKTLKLSKLNNWPDSMMCSQMITSRSPFLQVQNLHSPNKIQLVVTTFNIFVYKRSRLT